MNLITNDHKAVSETRRVDVTLTMAMSRNNELFITDNSWGDWQGYQHEYTTFSVLIYEKRQANQPKPCNRRLLENVRVAQMVA